MKIKTRDFGEVVFQPDEVIRFELPILGFEEEREFLLLTDDEFGPQFGWLQSTKTPALCFILFDPSALGQGYAPALPKTLEETLGGEEFLCWVLLVVREDFRKSTVNLKSPIIINMRNRKAAQIVLEQKYPVRFPIYGEEK